MKKIYKNIIPAAIAAIALTGCKEEYIPDYPSPQPKSEIGKAIVENTSLIASLSEDESWTVRQGLEATRLRYLAYNGKPIMMFFYEIDLNTKDLTISQTVPFDKPIGSGAEPVTKQALHVDAPRFKIWGGTNSDFGSESNGKPQGIFHHEGECLKDTFNKLPARPRSFFWLSKEKTAHTAPASDYKSVAESGVILEACGGGPVLVADGKTINIPDPNDLSVEPRTCIGVSKDGKKVYVMVVDGRRYTYSTGMSFHDMSELMHAIGCWSAINLDGGGSSTFFIRENDDFEDPDRFRILNWPTDNGGEERPVYCGLVFVETNE